MVMSDRNKDTTQRAERVVSSRNGPGSLETYRREDEVRRLHQSLQCKTKVVKPLEENIRKGMFDKAHCLGNKEKEIYIYMGYHIKLEKVLYSIHSTRLARLGNERKYLQSI